MGIESIKKLFVEQTTPVEVVMFILVSVAFFMLAVAIIYIAIMLLLWSLRLRKKVTLWSVFLPSGKQFKKNMGEYLLAVVTAFLVTVTLTAKHDLVEKIQDFRLTFNDLEKYEVSHLFPLHKIPDNLGLELGDLIPVSKLLGPALQAGRSDSAKLVVKAILKNEEFQKNPVVKLLTDQGILITSCAVLIILYLLWLASQRYQILKVHPEGKGSLGYGRTARSLFVLALCIALLLAAPSLVSDPEHLAESSLAALRYEKPESEVPVITQAINVQNQNLSFFCITEPPDTDSWQAQFGAINDRLMSSEECCKRMSADLANLAKGINDRVDDFVQSQNGQDERIAALENSDQNRTGQLNNLLAELNGVRDSLNEVMRKQQTLQDSQSQMDERYKTLEENFVSAITRLNDQLLQLNQMISNVGKRIDSFSEDLDRSNERIRGAEETISRVEERLGNAESLIRELTKLGQNLSQRLAIVEKKIADMEHSDSIRRCPDLVVEKIDRPVWDGNNGRSIIRATIKNIGSAGASSTFARVIDLSSRQVTRASYSNDARIPLIGAGRVTTVTFYLPYWVYNPDAELEVTADYKNELLECNENNNVRVFRDRG